MRFAVLAAMLVGVATTANADAQGRAARRGVSVSWTCAVGTKSITVSAKGERGSAAVPMILVDDKDRVLPTFGKNTEVRYRAAWAGGNETLSVSDGDKRFSIHPAGAVDPILAAISDSARAIDISDGGKSASGNCTRGAGALLSAGDTGTIQIGGSK